MARPNPGYPLETARTLRRVDVVAARDRLNRAEMAHRASTEHLARAERRLAEHRNASRPSAPAARPISASTLQRSATYRARQLRQETRLAETVATAREVCERTGAELEQARRELSAARTAETQVERHRQRYVAARRRVADDDEEREVESQWAARHALSMPERHKLA